MSIDPAAAEQEYDFFAQAANQVPQGPLGGGRGDSLHRSP